MLNCPTECYCESSNDNWEYLKRISELDKPIDIFFVIDGTETTWLEIKEFAKSFEEFANNFDKQCRMKGMPCLRVGMLIFGGALDSRLKEGLFNDIESRNEYLKNASVGYVNLTSDKEKLRRVATALKELAHIGEKEPWLDALMFASSKYYIDWKDNWYRYKIILLITDEPPNNDSSTSHQVGRKMLELDAMVYGLVEDISIGVRSAESMLRGIFYGKGKIYKYVVEEDNVIVSNDTSFPMEEAMKKIIKEVVEDLILKKKPICEDEEKCSECR